MDGNNNLAALVSTDAEFDHFEAVREEYEPALTKFVASAARDEMAALTEMSEKLPGRRTGTFAFVGADRDRRNQQESRSRMPRL